MNEGILKKRIWSAFAGLLLIAITLPARAGEDPAGNTTTGAASTAPDTTAKTKPSAGTPAASEVSSELGELQAELKAQAQQIADLELKLGIQPDSSSRSVAPSGPAPSADPSSPAPSASTASLPVSSSTAVSSAQNGSTEAGGSGDAPLFFKIGRAQFTPGGYVDLIGTFRSANVGTGLTTNLLNIPYNNTLPAGRLSEWRFNPTGSRISLKIDVPISQTTAVTGYIETDFAGYQPANTDTTTNPSSLRLRNFWVQVRHGKWELLAGQAWSLLTPTRIGLSPLSADIFTANRLDTSYVAGLEFARQPGIRITYHAANWWTLGASLENPQQFVPSSVAFPGASSGSFFSGQFDNGSSSTSGAGASTNTTTPNLVPDGLVKTAFDWKPNGRVLHTEIGGIVRVFKDYDNLVTPNVTNTVVGGGAVVNANLELFKNFHLELNSIYGDGVGRYIGALGPDVVINSNGTISPLHAGASVDGFEWQLTSRLLVDAYYGITYFGRDFTKPTPTTFVGYGYAGSSNSDNRTFNQATIGLITNIWSNPVYGRLQFFAQPAYVVRTPWAYPVGTPKDAHIFITYVSLRYTLP